MPQRGEVWLVDFGEPIGHEQGYRRPALIISADRLNGSRAGLAIVIPITSARRGLPSHIEIEPGASGLSQVSYAKTEDVKSISTQRLVRRFGTVGVDRLHLAEHALRLLLDL